MKQNRTLIVMQLLAISVLLYGNSNAQSKDESNLEEARIAIAKSNDIYFQAFVKGDSSIFIERYAKDCCIMPQNTPVMCSENAALNFFRIAYYKIGLRNGKFITTNVYGDGKRICDRGRLLAII
jgi:hypothetical protein